MMDKDFTKACPLPDGTVFSSRKHFRSISSPPLQAYASILGEERIERVERAAERARGLKLLQMNSSAQGGGVAEMLYSSIPFLDSLGLDVEWKVVTGSKEYFECTKNLHNLLQGKKGSFTPDMQHTYICTLEQCASNHLIDYSPDVVLVHDPQPLGLAHFLEKPGETWIWRCHIDIEQQIERGHIGLWDFVGDWTHHYDASIFSAAHYVVSRWPMPKFIIPPYIDPLSEKNRDMSQDEITAVLSKYNIDPSLPIIAQIGRFDPWKGIDRTIDVFRRVRTQRRCQLVVAGGLAADDPEAERILTRIVENTEGEKDIHILLLPLQDRLANYQEVNALQRAATIIMQPSIREGFGLVITEALWKGKPVIASNVGAIPLQVRDGETGLFYQSAARTARKVAQLLEHPKTAQAIGRAGRRYVASHFLMPDRVADELMAVAMMVQPAFKKDTCAECIISFHPWVKLSKRRRAYVAFPERRTN